MTNPKEFTVTSITLGMVGGLVVAAVVLDALVFMARRGDSGGPRHDGGRCVS